uniref:uncharacterized protein LOC120346683 isoform X2 n=1 Tax=Styela clava TaxID=7725 RepID=UPI0019399B0A|nr:uncharacterized protein LOC120346683 isoform X2 [Styela clava]
MNCDLEYLEQSEIQVADSPQDRMTWQRKQTIQMMKVKMAVSILRGNRPQMFYFKVKMAVSILRGNRLQMFYFKEQVNDHLGEKRQLQTREQVRKIALTIDDYIQKADYYRIKNFRLCLKVVLM